MKKEIEVLEELSNTLMDIQWATETQYNALTLAIKVMKEHKCQHEGCESKDLIITCDNHINTDYPNDCDNCEDRAKLLEAVGVDRIHKMIEKYDDSCGEDYDNSELALALNKEIVKAIK